MQSYGSFGLLIVEFPERREKRSDAGLGVVGVMGEVGGLSRARKRTRLLMVLPLRGKLGRSS